MDCKYNNKISRGALQILLRVIMFSDSLPYCRKSVINRVYTYRNVPARKNNKVKKTCRVYRIIARIEGCKSCEQPLEICQTNVGQR